METNSLKPKILYLMHVPWGWIKQRPHFFAEKLSKEFEIHVYDIEGIKNRNHYKNQQQVQGDVILKPLYLTGHLYHRFRKSKAIAWIYRKFFLAQISNFHSYKYIWISNVIFYKFIEPIIGKDQVLIYDCMDDDLEFPHIKKDSSLSSYYLKIENKLLNRANTIIFSASYLSDKVFKRSHYDRKKAIIVNNAIELPNLKESKETSFPSNIQEKIKILENNHPCIIYIGTISEWFDFDLIKIASSQYPELKWILFGPNEIDIPQTQNIIHLGSLPRQYIFQIMSKADALVMPFKITELIKSVNPVKLYEYIYSGKPVIAPFYEESKQFAPYVYLYNSEKDFLQLCKNISDGIILRKASYEECIEFVIKNTWDSRIKSITLNL